MIFIDYDGVIGNTEVGIFDDYYRKKRMNDNLTKMQYFAEMDWKTWIRKSGPKRNSFEILKSHDSSKASILTRVWSTQEAKEKILYIRENGVKNSIIIVPNDVKKSMIVDAFLAVSTERIRQCLDLFLQFRDCHN